MSTTDCLVEVIQRNAIKSVIWWTDIGLILDERGRWKALIGYLILAWCSRYYGVTNITRRSQLLNVYVICYAFNIIIIFLSPNGFYIIILHNDIYICIFYLLKVFNTVWGYLNVAFKFSYLILIIEIKIRRSNFRDDFYSLNATNFYKKMNHLFIHNRVILTTYQILNTGPDSITNKIKFLFLSNQIIALSRRCRKWVYGILINPSHLPIYINSQLFYFHTINVWFHKCVNRVSLIRRIHKEYQNNSHRL